MWCGTVAVRAQGMAVRTVVLVMIPSHTVTMKIFLTVKMIMMLTLF